jgi:hypothetical protein
MREVKIGDRVYDHATKVWATVTEIDDSEIDDGVPHTAYLLDVAVGTEEYPDGWRSRGEFGLSESDGPTVYIYTSNSVVEIVDGGVGRREEYLN